MNEQIYAQRLKLTTTWGAHGDVQDIVGQAWRIGLGVEVQQVVGTWYRKTHLLLLTGTAEKLDKFEYMVKMVLG